MALSLEEGGLDWWCTWNCTRAFEVALKLANFVLVTTFLNF